MIPKEHGGWAMLLIPFIVGLGVAAGFGLESALFLLCIVLVFMSSKPLNLFIRGMKVKSRRKKPAALRWLLVYLLAAGVVAAPIVLLYQRWWLVLLGGLGLLFLGAQAYIESRKMSLTVLGELIGALGLSLSAPGAYYVTTGELGLTALLLWFLTSLHSAGSVFYINMRLRYHMVKAKGASVRHRLAQGRDSLAYTAVLLVVLSGLSYLGHMPALVLLAFLPLVCKIAKGVYEAKPEISFKHLGLVELASSIVFAALIILSYIYA